MGYAKIATKKIIRIGNSSGLVIPKEWLEEMKLEIGSVIIMKKDLNKIVVDTELITHESVEKEAREVEEAMVL